MHNIHTVNKISIVVVKDKRTVTYTEHGRPCETPFGEFRSIDVLVDFAIAHLPHECVGYDHMHPVDVRKNLYQKMYGRCRDKCRGYRLL